MKYHCRESLKTHNSKTIALSEEEEEEEEEELDDH
jgi:hypothetical protein